MGTLLGWGYKECIQNFDGETSWKIKKKMGE
jgi:hypothetical protein